VTTAAYSWPKLLTALLSGESLSADATAWAMREIMAGDATNAQVAGFAMALRAKGETAEEVSGLAAVMLANTAKLDLGPAPLDAVDIVGTGGDRANTVNISTMAAVVAAAAGVRVVKHGNRAASSACGAADLLEALGVRIELSPAEVSRCVTDAGIGFCFASHFHQGLRYASASRRELGVPTVFNFLGPLTNPGQPRAAAIGCFSEQMAPVMAGVVARRGHSALVVRGEDGLDEVTTTAPTRFWIVDAGEVTETVFDVAECGLGRAQPADLRGGDPTFNAAVARAVFAGERGPVRDAVLVNAAAALATYDGITGSLKDALGAGLQRAAKAVDSGQASAVLDRWASVAQG
jgi:anthranilate phosphoribosyltransferase